MVQASSVMHYVIYTRVCINKIQWVKGQLGSSKETEDKVAGFGAGLYTHVQVIRPMNN